MAQGHTSDYWLEKGNEFYKNNSYDLALRCYDKAIETNSLDVDAWKNKGNVLKELGRIAESDAAFAKAKDLTTSPSDDVSTSGVNVAQAPDQVYSESTGVMATVPTCYTKSTSNYALIGFKYSTDLDDFLPILKNEDFIAADKFLAQNEDWIQFENGDVVYVDNYLEIWNEKEVRKPGETQKWWVLASSVVC